MSFGAMERWDGHRGFGPLNARLAMARAIELAKKSGIGLVALGNNTHWTVSYTHLDVYKRQQVICASWPPEWA